MDIVPEHDVYVDTRNTKKTFLLTDFICIDCGAIFNGAYEEECVLCDEEDKEIRIDEHKKYGHKCEHRNFIIGKQSVDIRILLNFSTEDVIALCELHGCSTGSRAKMTVNILKILYPYLDDIIDEKLIRKIIKRNNKRFWYTKDIDIALQIIKPKNRLKTIDISECYEVTHIRSLTRIK